jgi:site-specific DNA-methyltransferase (adenine-specific)
MVDAIVTDPPYHLDPTSGGMAGRAARRTLSKTDGSYQRLSRGFMGQAWDGGDIAFRAETWSALAAVLKPGGYLLAFGGTRTHHRIWSAIEDAGFVIQDTIAWLYGSGFPKGRAQLKPAFEPIVVAYKPGGPRALSIDECRIGTERTLRRNHARTDRSGWRFGKFDHVNGSTTGRWPANVVHDGSAEVMAAFAAFGASSKPNGRPNCKGLDYPQDREICGKGRPAPFNGGYLDAGTAARFFYCAKAGKADRAGSKHPTVKPVALLRWLVRLVVPPGGVVLDPFAGSGTTGAAALAENRRAILIEREAEYIADIRKRLNASKTAAAA